MLHLNLFHEQQQIQRDKDLDPVRLSIFGGSIIILAIMVWASFLYINANPIRSELSAKKAEKENVNKEFQSLGELTNLDRIKNQAKCINDFTCNRILVANQLDYLRELIPTNCQVRQMEMAHSWKKVADEKQILGEDLLLEVHTQSKSKVEVLQIRDQLMKALAQSDKFRDWAIQVPGAKDSKETINKVELVSSVTKDPQENTKAVGIFEIKMEMNVRDEPR